jgi:hypothetical protein
MGVLYLFTDLWGRVLSNEGETKEMAIYLHPRTLLFNFLIFFLYFCSSDFLLSLPKALTPLTSIGINSDRQHLSFRNKEGDKALTNGGSNGVEKGS